MVVDLFCGADFYGAHHFAGGDDDAAEGFGGGGHGGSCVLIDGLIDRVSECAEAREGGAVAMGRAEMDFVGRVFGS